MKIHSDILTRDDIRKAAQVARVDFNRLDNHGSRKRDHAYDITLTGESRRRPNGGNRGAGDDYAATWDQWGVFLGYLYNVDPKLVTPYYAGASDFHYRTDSRFEDGWPADTHGDHRFEYAGVPRTQACRKCSAVQRWS